LVFLKPQSIQDKNLHVDTPSLIFNPIPVALVLIAVIGFLALLFFNSLLFSLAGTMARIDLFAFGGGQAALPIMLHEVVYRTGG
jgi:hypothetical protein